MPEEANILINPPNHGTVYLDIRYTIFGVRSHYPTTVLR